MLRFLIMISVGCLLFSCNEHTILGKDHIPQKTIDNSLKIFPGNLVETSSSIIEGVQVWKVLIENDQGALVSFSWQKSYNVLFQVDGLRGPFNYELDLPLDVILFSSARFLAFKSHNSETLESWKLFRDKSAQNKLVYQFYLQNKTEPINIVASSGDPL